MNITPWPMNTSSSIVTPSQMKVWDEILQRAPIMAVLLDLDEGADFRPVADRTPVQIHEIGVGDDSLGTKLNVP